MLCPSPGCRLSTGPLWLVHASSVLGFWISRKGAPQPANPPQRPGPLPAPSFPLFDFSLLQVSQDGKALLDVLQRPLSPGNSESLTATANYSKAVHQVLDVVHEVLHHQRRLESIWQHRKVRLHQRLQLCVFQQDVQQVMPPPPPPQRGMHPRQADSLRPLP